MKDLVLPMTHTTGDKLFTKWAPDDPDPVECKRSTAPNNNFLKISRKVITPFPSQIEGVFVLVPGLPSEESKTGDNNACFIGRLLFMYNIMYKIPCFFSNVCNESHIIRSPHLKRCWSCSEQVCLLII